MHESWLVPSACASLSMHSSLCGPDLVNRLCWQMWWCTVRTMATIWTISHLVCVVFHWAVGAIRRHEECSSSDYRTGKMNQNLIRVPVQNTMMNWSILKLPKIVCLHWLCVLLCVLSIPFRRSMCNVQWCYFLSPQTALMLWALSLSSELFLLKRFVAILSRSLIRFAGYAQSDSGFQRPTLFHTLPQNHFLCRRVSYSAVGNRTVFLIFF